MSPDSLASDRGPAGSPAAATSTTERVRALVTEHFDAVWSFLRHLGVADVDDAAQEVMLIATRKVDSIKPGSERSFLFSVAYRVAAEARRSQGRQGQLDEDAIAELPDPAIGPEGQLDQEQARELLQRALSALAPELRAVLVLADIEEMTMSAIATVLGIPPGTVASRLRRAREDFDAQVRRLHAHHRLPGGRLP